MASAKLDGKGYVFLGDIGDNAGKRKDIRVYRVPEPRDGARTVRADRVYTLRYSDEPHNAETLMVHPKTGDLLVVTKAAQRPSMVFYLPRPPGTGRYTLEKVGELQLGSAMRESKLVTGGAISPDGRFVVLRTYLKAYEFPLSGEPGAWAKVEPTPVATAFEFQGEAITYSLEGDALLTTSEFSPCVVSKIPLAR